MNEYKDVINKYKDVMNSLYPTDEQKEKMFLKAEIMAEKESLKKRKVEKHNY